MNSKKENPTLVKVVQLAREHAYLGMYREASSKFSQGITMIQEKMKSLSSKNTLYGDLRELMSELIQESNTCKELDTFVTKGIVPLNPSTTHERNLPQVNRVNPATHLQEKKKYPFGQKPFQPQSGPGTNIHVHHNYNYTKPMGNYQQPTANYQSGHNNPPSNVEWMGAQNNNRGGGGRRNREEPDKDPDIWSPPPKKKSRGKKKSVAPVGAGGGPGPKGKRNYDKPWQARVEKKKKQKKKEELSPFMEHHYPDGAGPDVELIKMLEREIVDKNPDVKFEDIASLENAKQILKETVLLPLMMPNYFQGIRQPRKGVLLFGPPGTGKTMLAKAVATFGKTTFFNVHASSLASKWKGDSEKLVRLLFEMARFYAPTTIFFDEIDSIASSRDGGRGEGDAGRKVKSELLVQIDGASQETDDKGNVKNVIILGATNLPWDLDAAIVRRLDKRIYIPLPDLGARRELLKIMLKNEKVADDIDWDHIIKNTEYFSGDDMKNLCRDASMAPLRRWMMKGGVNFEEIKAKEDEFKNKAICDLDFKDALKNVKPTNSDEKLGKYKNWMDSYGSS